MPHTMIQRMDIITIKAHMDFLILNLVTSITVTMNPMMSIIVTILLIVMAHQLKEY